MKRSKKLVSALGAAALVAAFATPATASSHREAPNTAQDPQIDGTDTYAFVSPDDADTVTLIANFVPFQLPPGGPNFYPFSNDARYNLKIDTDGDAVPNLTYRFTFSGGFQDTSTFLYNTGAVANLDDATLNFKQNYTVEQVAADGSVISTVVDEGAVAPSNVGKASMPDYGALRQQSLDSGVGADGTKTFAGQSDDPFFLDLRVFDLLYGGDLSEAGNATLTGLNVNSIAVQLPKSVLATNGLDESGVIGVWSTSERQAMQAINADGTRDSSGAFVQTSRLGNPLVNELVSSVALKDAFNALKPEDDASVQGLVDRVNDPEVPKLIEKIYGIPAPATPREDLFSVFLTGIDGVNQPTDATPSEMIRLNTTTPVTAEPNRLGVLAGDNGGFPNGRRLADDVVDIELQVLEGAIQGDGSVKIVEPLKAGDAVDTNDLAFGDSFPYLALPHAGSKTGPGGLGANDTPGTTPDTTPGTTPGTTPAGNNGGGNNGGGNNNAGNNGGGNNAAGNNGGGNNAAGNNGGDNNNAGNNGDAPSGGVPSGLGGTAPTSGGSDVPVLPLALLGAGVAITGLGIARSKRSSTPAGV